MTDSFPLSTLFLLIFALPAWATDSSDTAHDGTTYLEGGILTYELFEYAVDHVDLTTCPAEFDPDATFCRMTLAAEQANVFVFSLDGDQPLLAIKHYPLDGDFLSF